MIFNKNDYDSKQRFGIRKLSVGVCSVLLSTLFLTMNNNQTVHASTESASNSATTTGTSESTQTEASGTPSAQSESFKNGAAQLKTSGAETPKKPDESKKDNVENPTQQSTTAKAPETPSLFDANPTIHLIHRTKDVTNTVPAAQETRTVTVNYVKTKVNEDGTYTEDGNAFTSAVLDVYYTRQATKDLVTGTVTYGPWQWNTKKGDSNTPGYHVVSGTWTNLPQEWATVTADVPTLDGYTAYTGVLLQILIKFQLINLFSLLGMVVMAIPAIFLKAQLHILRLHLFMKLNLFILFSMFQIKLKLEQ